MDGKGQPQAANVELYLHQQAVDTSTPSGRALFGMLGVFAEFERAMIVERVKAGMVRVKAQGKHVGRPMLSADTKRTVIAAIRAGQSNRAAAKAAGISEAAVRRIRKSA